MPYCETCPIRDSCDGYNEAKEDNELSYHPQTVIRAKEWDCHLIIQIKAEGKE